MIEHNSIHSYCSRGEWNVDYDEPYDPVEPPLGM